MAEVDSSGGGGKKKGPKKVSTKIDMTPMVDLAFLLITFFMLTTTFSKPKTMELNMPDKNKQDENDKQKVEETRTTTILLGEKDKIYYYTGIQDPKVEVTDYSATGIRKVLMQKIRERPKGKDPIFIIKAMEDARYKNMVDILDEMTITNSKIYALVDITPGDVELVDKYKKDNNITE
jgi:biopolymer transport protein ExbD